MNEKVLDIHNLKTYFFTRRGNVKAVDGVSFEVSKGDIVGIMGETGCGKSVTALSILRLIPHPGKIIGGEVIFNGKNLIEISDEEMRQLRGKEISMIFQDPMTSLNPVYTIGDQVSEAIRSHQDISRTQAMRETLEMLEKVSLPDSLEVVKKYPHELSGGMRQRAMIAMAIVCTPLLLIADEPTTSLDVTIQAQILKLIKKLRNTFDTSVLLISHDFGVISEMCDKVMVMYAGVIVESADVYTIYEKPAHPYTRGLIKSVLKIDMVDDVLETISGIVPNPLDLPPGCPFNPRCRFAKEICCREIPTMTEIEPGHFVRCFNGGKSDRCKRTNY